MSHLNSTGEAPVFSASPALAPAENEARQPASAAVRPSISAPDIERILDRTSTFAFHFQPIVDLHRGVTVGFEALVRFTVDGARVPPNLVFEAASLFGRRCELEFIVLEEAFNARHILPPNCFLTVNVGPAFLLSPHFDILISRIPSLAGVIVEVTEDEPITDYDTVQRKLALIRSKGGLAAVDDAGSGYASLQHIMQIRPNFIKLDRNFITSCDADPAKGVLIEMLGRAANRLDAWIIAEGLETRNELDELMRLGVPLAQGFYLARPEPAMRTLDDEKALTILKRAGALSIHTNIERSVEHAFSYTDRSDAQSILETLADRSVGVVLNSCGQPLETFERHPLLGVRRLDPVMTVQTRSNAHEVLDRALNRPSACRFDPILVINELGRLKGVLHIDRLMRETLAS
jgi:EAL domain-containing protein (putative c-di-GMP-specific phosphodiesterase class I)